MKIYPVVEGQGEVSAMPVLLRRLRDQAQSWQIECGQAIRQPRSQLVKKDSLQRAVRIASLQEECSGILIVIDADDDCPRHLAPLLHRWAMEAAGAIPCAVVIANREFEAWFIASMESLRGRRRILPDAVSHQDPETPRNAKGEVERRMHPGASYSPTADQASLTEAFDMRSAYRACRSFRKLVSAFGALAVAAGDPPVAWPPVEWVV